VGGAVGLRLQPPAPFLTNSCCHNRSCPVSCFAASPQPPKAKSSLRTEVGICRFFIIGYFGLYEAPLAAGAGGSRREIKKGGNGEVRFTNRHSECLSTTEGRSTGDKRPL
jgi:hypothetical protein